MAAKVETFHFCTRDPHDRESGGVRWTEKQILSVVPMCHGRPMIEVDPRPYESFASYLCPECDREAAICSDINAVLGWLGT